MTTTFLWTDGASSPNGFGGWGCIAVEEGREAWRISGSSSSTTNNRMELTAIMQGVAKALLLNSDNVIVCTDSQYAILMLETSHAKMKANDDIILQTRSLLRRIPFKFEWVKGHSGVTWNELADKLATTAKALQTGSKPAAKPPRKRLRIHQP